MRVITLILVLGIGIAPTSNVQAQDMETLISQLAGKTEAPQRAEVQLTEAYEKAVGHLIPLMGADDVESRYGYQIALQDMGAHAARPGAETQRRALAEVMVKALEQTEMPKTVRYWLVLQLERIGKEESVAALEQLMASDDTNLRDCARRALQANPADSATTALVKAFETATDPTLKVSLASTLGARRDQTAVGSLAKAINARDPKVEAAVITALSQISGRNSALALMRIMRAPFGPTSINAVQGLLDIARERIRHNDYANAVAVYGAVYDWATKTGQDPNTPNPVAIRAAAINGLIRYDVTGGAKRAIEAIKDKDPTIRAAAVQAARRAPRKAPAEALGTLLPDLDAQSQVQVLGLLADRGVLSFVKFVTTVLASEDESVRLAVIEALTKIGGDIAAATLLEIAAGGDDASKKAASEGLVLIVGPLVDDVIATAAATGNVKSRSVAIGVLAKRRTPGAAQALLGYAAEDSREISLASHRALVDVADSVDLAKLAGLLIETTNGDIRKGCATALRAALSNANNKDVAAQTIIDQMQTSNANQRLWLLSCLDAAGGTTALKTVIDAAESTDQQVRDTGVRTLANWPNFEAAKPLLELASKPQTSLTHYVLATRGTLRLITSDESASLEDRVALCFQAFDQSRRDDERRGVIAAMGSLPSQEVAERLLTLAHGETLKAEAALAAVELAGSVLRTDRQAATEYAEKIRDLNISDEVNRRAEAVIRGRKPRRR